MIDTGQPWSDGNTKFEKDNPTSGPHQPAQDDKKAQTKFNLWTPRVNQQRQQHDQEMSRGGRFRNSRFHQPTLCREHEKHAEFIGFHCVFKHIEKFEAISKHRPLTGQGLEALFDNPPKKINDFLAWFYWCSRDYEQRHRRRTAHFARATAPQTYYMFCKNS